MVVNMGYFLEKNATGLGDSNSNFQWPPEARTSTQRPSVITPATCYHFFRRFKSHSHLFLLIHLNW